MQCFRYLQETGSSAWTVAETVSRWWAFPFQWNAVSGEAAVSLAGGLMIWARISEVLEK